MKIVIFTGTGYDKRIMSENIPMADQQDPTGSPWGTKCGCTWSGESNRIGAIVTFKVFGEKKHANYRLNYANDGPVRLDRCPRGTKCGCSWSGRREMGLGIGVVSRGGHCKIH